MTRIRIDIPATCSGFGVKPGALALAVGLYNTVEVVEIEQGMNLEVEGDAENVAPGLGRSLVFQAARLVFRNVGIAPSGLQLRVVNNIPLDCGLGSKEASIIGGLLGANELLGSVLSRESLTDMALELGAEAARYLAALHGNLRIVTRNSLGIVSHGASIGPLSFIVLSPRMRDTIPGSHPAKVDEASGSSNDGATALIVQALMAGNLELLRDIMTDSMTIGPVWPVHRDAANAALESGAIGAFVSGSGPALVAIVAQNPEPVASSMVDAWRENDDVEVDSWILPVETHGISVSETGVSFGGPRALPTAASAGATGRAP